MRTVFVLAIAAVCGGAVTPVYAQKNPPRIVRDADRDGVPDDKDSCAATPLGARVDVRGCPLPAPAPVAAATPAAGTPATSTTPSNPTQVAGNTGIANQATQPHPNATGQPGAPGASPAPGAAGAVTNPAGAPAGPPVKPGTPPSGLPSTTGTTGNAAAPTTPAGGAPSNPAAPNANAPGAHAPSAASAIGASPTTPANPPAGSAAQPTTGQPANANAPANAATNPAATNPTAARPNAPAGGSSAPSGGASPVSGAANAAGTVLNGAANVAGAVTPNRPAAPAAAPAPRAATTDATLTEGFLMPAWTASSGSAVEYVRGFALKLDSASLALIERFRNAPGQPVVGATDPTKLVSREKLRWQHCRNVKEDLATFADNIPGVQENLPGQTLQSGWADLGEKLNDLLDVLDKCATVAAMIELPDATTRYAPWQTNYERSAREFYADWYTKLQAMHRSMISVARLLQPSLAADRKFNLPPLSPTPPTLGAR